MICKLCGVEKETRRQMHGHLMACHYEDYKGVDFNLDQLVDGAPARIHDDRIKKYPRPNGFRFLSQHNDLELYAIQHGYKFIDDDGTIYTETEARTQEWI